MWARVWTSVRVNQSLLCVLPSQCLPPPQESLRLRLEYTGMDAVTARISENGTKMTEGEQDGDRRWSGTWSLKGEVFDPPGKAPWPWDLVILTPVCPLLWIWALAVLLSEWPWVNYSCSLSLNCFIHNIGKTCFRLHRGGDNLVWLCMEVMSQRQL